MTAENGFLSYFLHASFIVQGVMVLLILASILSWSTILQGMVYYWNMHRSTHNFEKKFWSGEELADLYAKIHQEGHKHQGTAAIFSAGFKEFLRFRQQNNVTTATLIDNIQRAMQASQIQIQDRLEAYLPFLATIGSISPYIGLFGTIWGIMQSFSALSTLNQASIAIIAPGISEALIATALGLFAAIPAVIAYNRLLAQMNRLLNRFYMFQEEFINILIRHLHQTAYSPIGEK